jgi:predicted kinase
MPVVARGDREVTLVMGIPGAGKSRLAAALEAEGHERLNRDALGGTLRGIARRLDERLRSGATKLVLDNTYVTRASRSDVVRIAHANGARVRCIFVDTPLHEAQRNVAMRLLEKTGSLTLGKRDEVAVAPIALFRMVRELERPTADEGFSSIELVTFERVHEDGEACIVVPHESLARALPLVPDGVPLLVYAWRPGGNVTLDVPRATAALVCTHPSGPPTCWCRPPLPGLFVAFARAHRIDARKSILLAETPAHRTFAKNVGLTVRDIA